MDFGNILKKLRQDNNLTQEELAKKINSSRSNIANYENGKNKPSVEILEKLANILNCSMDYLMGNSDKKNRPIIDINDLLLKYSDYIKQSYMPKIEYHILTEEENDILQDMFYNFAKQVDGSKNYLPLSYFKNKVNDDRHWRTMYGIYFIYTKYVYDVFSNLNEEFSNNYTNNVGYAFKNNLESNSCNQYYMCPVYGQISAGQPNWAEECIEGRLPLDTDLMGIVNPEEHFFLRVNGESMNKVIKNGAFALIHKQDLVDDGDIAVVLVNGYDATLKKFTKQGDFVILEPQSNDESFKSQVYDKTTPIKIIGKYVGKMEFN